MIEAEIFSPAVIRNSATISWFTETDHQRLKSNERSCISPICQSFTSSCFLVALSSLRQLFPPRQHNSRTSSLSLCTKSMKERTVFSRINSNWHSSLFLCDWTHWSVLVPYRDERCSYMYCVVHVQLSRRKQPRLLISSRADDCGMANKNGNAKVGRCSRNNHLRAASWVARQG